MILSYVCIIEYWMEILLMKNNTPRRKRMRRQNRLEVAKHWVKTYVGKNIIKGYQNWFGVDLICAVKELKILGIKLDEQYIDQALKNMTQLILLKQKKDKEKKKHELDNIYDSDENFYFIAGYTSCGFPYGIKWEEIETQNEPSFSYYV